MQGAKEAALTEDWAVLVRSVKGSIERESYLPARLTTNEEGRSARGSFEMGRFIGFCCVHKSPGINHRASGRKNPRRGDEG